MRLLNVHNHRLEDFSQRSVPPYAILSHTWDAKEITLQEWISPWQSFILRQKASKIFRACELAREHHLDYVWIDTCCIDKTSSAELSESINSMFRWYQQAVICFVYLVDLPASLSLEHGLAACRWLERGWTLQELIAPSIVEFYNASWELCGTKAKDYRLIARCTGIPDAVLSGQQKLDAYSVSTRMSWTASRQTTRPEDKAYCLLGIFDVNMPCIYGEGSRSFDRLQQAVRRQHLKSLSFTSACYDTGLAPDLEVDPRMYSLRVPRELLMSYQNWSQYPSNLINKDFYATSISFNTEVIDAMISTRQTSRSSIRVVFADLHPDKADTQFTMVASVDDLMSVLGDQSKSVWRSDCITRRDPRSRLIFLTASPASNLLLISKEMLLRILSYYQVPVQYLDLLSCTFRSNEHGQSGNGTFWGSGPLSHAFTGLEAPDLGRSGHYYEMTFALQGVERSVPLGSRQNAGWSVCGTTIYHKFDVVHGSSLWVLTETTNKLQTRVTGGRSTKEGQHDDSKIDPVGCYVASLYIHLSLARWATEAWTKYLSHLGNVITLETQGLVNSDRYPNTNDIRKLQSVEEKALVTFYSGMLRSSEFPFADRVQQTFIDFSIQVQNVDQVLSSATSIAERLLTYTHKRKADMLTFMQAETYAQSRAVKESTLRIAEESERNAITMRVITVITLMYLPGIFVMSIYSSNIISYGEYPYSLVFRKRSFVMYFLTTSVLTAATSICWFAYHSLMKRKKMLSRNCEKLSSKMV